MYKNHAWRYSRDATVLPFAKDVAMLRVAGSDGQIVFGRELNYNETVCSAQN